MSKTFSSVVKFFSRFCALVAILALCSNTAFGAGSKKRRECGTEELPPIKTPMIQNLQRSVTSLPQLAMLNAGPVEINVLVAYTVAASSQAPSSGGIGGLIVDAVNKTNDAYLSSNVNIHLNLVGSLQVGYVESGSFNTDLSNVILDNDQLFENLKAFRSQQKADIVVLLEGHNASLCGVAYTMSTPSLNAASRAFAVVAVDCAVSNMSFAHEIGHLFGAGHDPINGDSSGRSYPFSNGYNLPGTSWRTIMSIKSGLLRIPYFSNPDVSYFGAPTGVAGEGPDAANNALTLNLNAPVVAYFQDDSGATYSMNGYVLDAQTGEPVAGALVDTHGPIGKFVTGSNGYFHFDHIAPGSQYNITTSLLGYSFESALSTGTVESDMNMDITGEQQLPSFGPDLIVSYSKISGALISGKSLRFKAKVFNQGTQDLLADKSSPFESKVRINYYSDPNGQWVEFKASTSSRIKPGRSKSVTFKDNWKAVKGTHSYQICADSSIPHRELETNESNNCTDPIPFTVN